MTILLPLVAGLALLLFLILRLKIPAFISLLIATILIGMMSGIAIENVFDTVQKGMGNTLGYVATVVGLGALFGALLEKTGGAQQLADQLLKNVGPKKAPWALLLIGFVLAIPVFFDVAFIILIPVLYALQQQSGHSLLRFALPLLAGLAVTHAFIPPTPGPIAVADILGAELGWVIVAGLLTGIPAAIVAGVVYGRFAADKIFIAAPKIESKHTDIQNAIVPPQLSVILSIVLLPLFLIVGKALLKAKIFGNTPAFITSAFVFLGHPFAALITANLLAWYLLGIKRGHTKHLLYDISMASFAPAGSIILLTGAGGALKEMLISTSIGVEMAQLWLNHQSSLLGLAFGTAALVRILQGSSTVAMITAAGILAPFVENTTLSPFDLSLLVVAIAAGASLFSHVNDSGFWLVSQYMGMSEKQTFRSWTMMTTVLGIVGFATACLLSLLL